MRKEFTRRVVCYAHIMDTVCMFDDLAHTHARTHTHTHTHTHSHTYRYTCAHTHNRNNMYQHVACHQDSCLWTCEMATQAEECRREQNLQIQLSEKQI